MTIALANQDSRAVLEFDVARFARTLTERAVISPEEWELARQVARQGALTPLGAMLDLGQVSESALADELASWLGLARWDAELESGQPSERVPEMFLRRAGAALFERENDLHLVLSDPSDRFSVDALVRSAPDVSIEIASAKDVEAFYSALDAESGTPNDGLDPGDSTPDVARELSALRDLASEAPVIRFWNQALERAIDLGASDIHIERFDRRSEMRFRVDGALLDQPPPPLDLFEPLLCRLKIMAGLDIAERRKPQDGRLQVKLRGRSVDLRLSLIPTIHGQDAALRIQDRQKLSAIGIGDLGFEPEQIEQLRQGAGASHGLVLITGPTGSGKTTTLYALLKTLLGTRRKLITVEDPVEYALTGVNQIQINPNVDLTFSTALRHILRHDPDVVLVGEIRDRETAQIAFQASLTGHLVLSTLHTNDVPSTFVRLVDMQIEPYLVGAAVELVTAQRLLRLRCAMCDGADTTCRSCAGVGYRGRIAIMESSRLTPGAKRVLLEGSDEQRLREALGRDGYVPLVESARRLVARGVTDEREVLRGLGVALGGAEA